MTMSLKHFAGTLAFAFFAAGATTAFSAQIDLQHADPQAAARLHALIGKKPLYTSPEVTLSPAMRALIGNAPSHNLGQSVSSLPSAPSPHVRAPAKPSEAHHAAGSSGLHYYLGSKEISLDHATGQWSYVATKKPVDPTLLGKMRMIFNGKTVSH